MSKATSKLVAFVLFTFRFSLNFSFIGRINFTSDTFRFAFVESASGPTKIDSLRYIFFVTFFDFVI